MGVTTIKVSADLRDRINRDARAIGVTASALIERLLDEYERSRRMTALGDAMRGADASYWDEFQVWDASSGDSSDMA